MLSPQTSNKISDMDVKQSVWDDRLQCHANGILNEGFVDDVHGVFLQMFTWRVTTHASAEVSGKRGPISVIGRGASGTPFYGVISNSSILERSSIDVKYPLSTHCLRDAKSECCQGFGCR